MVRSGWQIRTHYCIYSTYITGNRMNFTTRKVQNARSLKCFFCIFITGQCGFFFSFSKFFKFFKFISFSRFSKFSFYFKTNWTKVYNDLIIYKNRKLEPLLKNAFFILIRMRLAPYQKLRTFQVYRNGWRLRNKRNAVKSSVCTIFK